MAIYKTTNSNLAKLLEMFGYEGVLILITDEITSTSSTPQYEYAYRHC